LLAYDGKSLRQNNLDTRIVDRHKGP
jgi:hypothetical protein